LSGRSTDAGDDLAEKVFAALRASVDTKALASRLEELGASGEPRRPASSPPASAPAREHGKHHEGSVGNELLARWSLADVLDESILHANPGDKGYPLRILFGEMSAGMATSDEALTFAAAVNLYFRTSGDEESRVALGMEVSRAFYAFARSLDAPLRASAAQSLAVLLSSDLPRVRFESTDHLTAFDSAVHERERGSGSGAAIREVRTFLCRITATGLVRAKARVLT
jgi:hypothetical protein